VTYNWDAFSTESDIVTQFDPNEPRKYVNSRYIDGFMSHFGAEGDKLKKRKLVGGFIIPQAWPPERYLKERQEQTVFQ
jgi:hypothetical protein